MSMVKFIKLLGVRLLPVGLDDALIKVVDHITQKNGDYFCLCNIHIVMECYKDHALRDIINQSSANFPDGKGLVMGLGMLGYHVDFKVRGTDLMLRLCEYSTKNGLKIFLYGDTGENLIKLKRRLNELFPGINIVGSISPPFRKLAEKEREDISPLCNKPAFKNFNNDLKTHVYDTAGMSKPFGIISHPVEDNKAGVIPVEVHKKIEKRLFRNFIAFNGRGKSRFHGFSEYLFYRLKFRKCP